MLFFAIVITLLVIEIKVPEADPGATIGVHELAQTLLQQIPHYVGFIFTGTFWQTHHRIFGYITNYDSPYLAQSFFADGSMRFAFHYKSYFNVRGV